MKKRLIMGFILVFVLMLNTLSADTAKHWAEPFLQKLVEEGLMTGYPGGDLKPEKELSREEASSILAKYLGYDGGKKASTFADMKGRWSEGAIAFLAEKKVVGGYPDGNFYPEKAVSKEEMAAMTYRILEKKINFAKVEVKVFSDLEDRWSKGMVEKLAGLGIINGFDGKFSPSQLIKRGETAALLSNLLTAEKSDAFKKIALEEKIDAGETPRGKIDETGKKKDNRSRSTGSSSSSSSNPGSSGSNSGNSGSTNPGGSTPPPAVSKYSIEVEGGKSNVSSAATGETVTLTAEIPDGKDFVKWEVLAGDVKPENSPVSSFKMGKQNVKVKAVFQDKQTAPQEDKDLKLAKENLKRDIDAAKLSKKDILIAELASEVEKGKQFVTAVAKDAFDKIIEKAELVYEDLSAKVKDVTDVASELKDAQKKFLEAIQIGTKEDQPIPTPHRILVEGGRADRPEAKAGETVTVTAASDNGTFKKWVSIPEGSVTFADPNASETTFTMPDKEVSIKAEFEAPQGPDVPSGKLSVVQISSNGILNRVVKEGFTVYHTDVNVDKKFSDIPVVKDILAWKKGDKDKDIKGWKVNNEAKVWTADELLDTKVSAVAKEVEDEDNEFMVYIEAVMGDASTPIPPPAPQPEEKHSITVEGGSADKTEAKKGETVTVTADSDKGNFEKWVSVPEGSVNFADAASEETTFTMPDKDVTVKAVFEQSNVPAETLTLHIYRSTIDTEGKWNDEKTSYDLKVKSNQTFQIVEDKLKEYEAENFDYWWLYKDKTFISHKMILNLPFVNFAEGNEGDRYVNLYAVKDLRLPGNPTPPEQDTHSIRVEGGRASKDRAKAGETITITADNGDFIRWEIVQGKGAITLASPIQSTTTFEMPNEDVSLKAHFNGASTPGQDELKSYKLYVYYSELKGNKYEDELVVDGKPVTNQQTFQVVEKELDDLVKRNIDYFLVRDNKYSKELLMTTKFHDDMRYIEKGTWKKTNDIILYAVKKVKSDEDEEETPPAEADKLALDDKIEAAKQYETKEAEYSAESFAEFKRALANAKNVSADQRASQQKVNAAFVDLIEAINNLKPKGSDQAGEASLIFTLKSKEFPFLMSSQCAYQSSALGDFDAFQTHPSAMTRLQNNETVKISKIGSLGFVVEQFGDYQLSDFDIKINGKKVNLKGKNFSGVTGASPVIVLRPKDKLQDGDFELLSENKIEINVAKSENGPGAGDDEAAELEDDLAKGLVDTDRALELIKKANPNLVVFDVRTDGEFHESKIKVEGLLHKDMLQEASFKEYIKTLDKNKVYLLYCRTQKRSAEAARWMKKEGFSKVLYMDGGITKWLKEDNKKEYTVFPKTPLALDLTLTGDKDVYAKGIVELNVKLTNTHEGKDGIRKGLVTLNVKGAENKVIKTQELTMGDDGSAKASIDLSDATNGTYLVEALAKKDGYKDASAFYVLTIGDADQASNLNFTTEQEKGKFKHISQDIPEYQALEKNYGKNMLSYKVKKADGQVISLYDFIEDKSKPTVVLFGFPACGGCREMMKFMSEVEKDKYNYVELITSVDDDMSKTVEQTERVMRDLGIENMTSHVVYDAEDKIWQSRLDLKTTPNFMILDTNGRMVNMADHVYAPVYAEILKNSLGIDVKVPNTDTTPKPNGDARHNAAFNAIYKMNIGDFELTDLNGNTKKIKDIVDGKRATLIGLGSMNCSACKSSWRSFNKQNLDELPFNMIEAFNKQYDSEGADADRRILENSIFKNVSDVDSRLEHFYYGGDEIYTLPRDKDPKLSFEFIPIGLFLDKDCRIVEFEFKPDFSQGLVEKGKRITNTIY
ncbi:MAG: S-layer homology domain-containing protein [Bacillota bacterium]|nr:S-layer homology domain-containing protein [Bacillota bacterium]